MKQIAKERKLDQSEKHLQRVRRICNALPETMEKLSHGEPTFFVRKKVFAMISNNHHNDGHVAVTLPAAIGIQAMLIERSPEKFYKPPYVGVRGWVGVELDQVSDEELAFHVHEAWRLIAPEKLHALIQTAPGESQGSAKEAGDKEYGISAGSKKRKSTRTKRA